jgi:pyruvate kinase
MPSRFTVERVSAAIEALSQLRDHQIALARSWDQELQRVPPAYRPSALNLLHYLALRQHDLGPLQQDLTTRPWAGPRPTCGQQFPPSGEMR